MAGKPIRLLLADVDGTLVTQDKVLTDRAIEAVRKANGGRGDRLRGDEWAPPPKGMSMLIDPLDLTDPDRRVQRRCDVYRPVMTVLEQQTLPADLVVPPISDLMHSFDWL